MTARELESGSEESARSGRAGAGDGLFAAVDLGSRSFHLTVARVHGDEHGDHVEVVDRVRESVRLAAGLRDKRIEPETWSRAEAALSRIGERVRTIPARQTRAVATNTFRQLRNRREALQAASRALGQRVEVISGAEEARLIYIGVTGELPGADERRLVLDIGGGSTEAIIGRGGESILASSLYLGCVSLSRRFFGDGAISRAGFSAAEAEAEREFERIEDRFLAQGWDAAIGSSGTVRATADLLRVSGRALDPAGLRELKRRMLAAGGVDALLDGPRAIPGFPADRAWDFPGGVAILRAAMRVLGIDRLAVSDGALREGVLHDLIGRRRHLDVRESTIRKLMEQYRVDSEQADRVRRTALAGFRQLADGWELDEHHERFLRWGASLHEIGLAISFTGHHRHGAYIARNSEMPGFSRDDQDLLAALIETHRRRLRPERLEGLANASPTSAARLAAILRIAVLLCRRRSREPLPAIEATVEGPRLSLRFPADFLGRHPLTRLDLADEARELAQVGIELAALDTPPTASPSRPPPIPNQRL